MKLWKKECAVLTMTFLLSAFAAGCSDAGNDVPDKTAGQEGIVSFGLYIPGSGDQSGEDAYNENRFRTLDIFFYDMNTGDDEAALLHRHETLSDGQKILTVRLSADEMQQLGFPDRHNYFKAVAVANCSEVLALGKNETSIRSLRSVETRAEAGASVSFCSASAPESFVMHTFDNPAIIAIHGDGESSETYKLHFKRLAAKIRVALAVTERVTDENGVSWLPDVGNMRLYISNGVGASRLDGDMEHTGRALGENDYYHIATSASGETEDYAFARLLTRHDTNSLSGKKDETYLYYNDIPYYTYPNEWSGREYPEAKPTMLVIAIPWESEDAGDSTTRMPAYYTMPVNNDGTIASDTYYYLRVRIGTMGSRQYDAPAQTDAIYMKVSQWIIDDNYVMLW